MKKFLLAIQFLTVFPVHIKTQVREEDYKGIFSYFPLVGACLGLLLAFFAFALGFMPHAAMVACIITLYIVMTGALHIDGFADTCDGFFSGKPKDRVLEIMHDSRIGTMGCVGLWVLLVLKFTFLIGLGHEFFWRLLIAVPVYSRWAQGVACHFSEYARGNGKSNYFFNNVTVNDIVFGGIFSIIIFLILVGLKGFLLFILGFIPVFLFMRFSQSRIGGMTGDTLGAANEIAEISILFFSLILFR